MTLLFSSAEMHGVADDELHVLPIPKAEADAIIVAGHYSKSVAWSSSVHLGVFWRGEVIGALQFGPAMNPSSGGAIVRDTAPHQWLELNRLWLSDEKPENCGTRVLSQAFRQLQRLRPEVKWVQSFADERCGKWGAIYQAASFIYCGDHTSRFYNIDGEWFHKSMKGRAEFDKRGWWSGPKIARFRANEHRATAHEFRQFRYLKFLDGRWRKRLLLSELPYPKPSEVAA